MSIDNWKKTIDGIISPATTPVMENMQLSLLSPITKKEKQQIKQIKDKTQEEKKQEDKNKEDKTQEDRLEQVAKKVANLKLQNSWNDTNEEMIANIGENSASYKWMHEYSSKKYATRNTYLNIFLVFLTSVLSASTFFAEPAEPNSALDISKRVIIYLTNVATVVYNYLKWGELSAQYSTAQTNFSELYHRIQQQVVLYRSDRVNAIQFVQDILQKYDDLLHSSPPIDESVVKVFKQRFKNPQFAIPDIADKIERIRINKNLQDIEDNKESSQSPKKEPINPLTEVVVVQSHPKQNFIPSQLNNMIALSKISGKINDDLADEDFEQLEKARKRKAALNARIAYENERGQM